MSRPALIPRLVAALAAAAVVLGGGILLWGETLWESWSVLEKSRLHPASQLPPAEWRAEQIRLAFLAPDGRTLEEETREVVLQSSVSAAARTVLEELRAGSRQGRGAVLPLAVRVGQVFVDQRGVAYVGLSGEFLEAGSVADAALPVVRAGQAVAASLGMSLPEIAQVQILVGGREVPLTANGVDLRHPLPAALPSRPLELPQ